MFRRFGRFVRNLFKREVVEKEVEVLNTVVEPEPQKEEVYGMLKVIKESDSGRNLKFQDTVSGRKMTAEETKELIRAGKYPDYLVTRNGVIRSRPGVKNLG